MTLGERIHQIEVEGYLLLPDLLTPDHVTQLKTETAKLKTRPVDYSVHQQGCPGIQFIGGAIATWLLIFLPSLFCESFSVTRLSSCPTDTRVLNRGTREISLHTDGQPYGSEIFGYEGSVPTMVRVLYYLDDLTTEVSPFRVVPRSHLSMHADGNPYKRYKSHPEEVMVPAKAGSAVLINHKVFHGNFPNTGDRARRMLAIAYRPAWAGPIKEVSTWDGSEVAKLPDNLRPLYGDCNTRHWDYQGGNKPPNMASAGAGLESKPLGTRAIVQIGLVPQQ